jgi:GNAT superfamily N-acetyltransferase
MSLQPGFNIAVTRAGEGDVAEIGIIGPAAYAAAYYPDWDDPVAFMKQVTTFGPEAVRAFLARPEARAWIARQDGVGVGFLTMVTASDEPLQKRRGGVEIPRIYLLPNARRGGIGRKLMDAAEAQARAEGAAYIWLDVMAHAPWARSAYERWGFTDIGGKTFAGGIRQGLNEMRVMVKELRS